MTFVEVGASDSKLDKKKRVIRKLVQLELTEKVAKAAVQCVPSLDVDDCYLWALEYGTEEEVVAEHLRKFDEEVGRFSSARFASTATIIRI